MATAASFSSSTLLLLLLLLSKLKLVSSLLFLLILTLIISDTDHHKSVHGCYTSIFSFGDSLADTGNLLNDCAAHKSQNFCQLPYGQTYFHHPTGRFSDGRLIVDFIAEAAGLPFLPPFLGNNHDFGQGVNFAIGGATALDKSFFDHRGIYFETNYTLGVQLEWFKQLLPSLCNPSSFSSDGCEKLLKKSLFLMGEIGGNDYNYPFFQGKTTAEIRAAIVPQVIDVISSAINVLIEEGAVTLVVPGNLPIGCSSAYLTYFKSSNQDDYDSYGCLKWLNKFSIYHNELLQKRLDDLRRLHPHATIAYADYYNAAMGFYRSPEQLGFRRGALSSCCGGGGPYNFNTSATCGLVGSTVCEDPSLYVGWDGVHLTEAAYRSITTYLLQVSLSQLNIPCSSSFSTKTNVNLIVEY